MRVRVAVSLGDPSGIGPEVVASALAALRGRICPLAFGDASFERLLRGAGLELPVVDPGDPLPLDGALVRVTRLAAADRRHGTPSPAGGAASLRYLDAAFGAVIAGAAQALCTAPLSKAQVALSLPGFVGHTEWLEARGGGSLSVMMLAGRRLRVALVTNHLSLREAVRRLTPARIVAVAQVAADGLRRDFGIALPRLAVAGVNPHAGEGGAFGDEEARIVAPAVARLRAEGIDARGPYPPDSVFLRAAAGEFDGVVALYHDQGLIPVKLLDAVLGDSAVNVTLGLPFVRTSPDHGVAWDIAGKGRANDRSMRAALRMAAAIARRRGRPAAS